MGDSVVPFQGYKGSEKKTAHTTMTLPIPPPPATAVHLPLELIEEILHRLPPKSLGLFKCVSKPLNALISSPRFIKARLARTDLPLEKLILRCPGQRSLHSVDFLKAAVPQNGGVLSADATEFKLLPPLCEDVSGSVNGLVFSDYFDEYPSLINPMTGECVRLPSCPFTHPANLEDYDTVYGLGHDSLTDDYKVVKISSYLKNEIDEDIFINVYSLNSNCWGRATKSNHYVESESGVYLNGCLHWLCYGPPYHLFILAGISSFNLETEEFEAVPLPVCVDDERSVRVMGELGVVNGCLCFVVKVRDSLTMDVWVMKEYGVRESWKKYSIYRLSKDILEGTSMVKPLCLLGTSEIVMEVGKKLVVYDIQEKVFTDVVVRGIPDNSEIKGTYVKSPISCKCSKAIEGGFEGCVPIEDQIYLQVGRCT